jgi:hypothetical protein
VGQVEDVEIEMPDFEVRITAASGSPALDSVADLRL